MAKRRTKKEKIIARLRRQVKAQNPTSLRKMRSYAGAQKVKKKRRENKQEYKEKKEDIFGYDPRLINKDLKKTALLSFVFTALIIALWFWQQ